MFMKKLLRTAWSYKSQFISMIIMIAIGVGVFLGFNIEWYSLEKNATAFLSDTNYADYRIYSETGFSSEDISALQGIDGVDAATRYFSVNAGIKGSKDSLSLNVSENNTVSTLLVTEGAEYNEKSEGMWLSDKFAKVNDVKIGDSITVTYKGIEITCIVEGLCKSGENMICVADENQIMPDYDAFGFAYVTPNTLKSAFGFDYYPQINIISSISKAELENAIKDALDTTFLVITKDENISYAGVKSESEEGKTMGSILPVLFLAIAILTMVTTMHRISANEKVQIGTLKALGFRDRRILVHYTSYGLLIGIAGLIIGVGIGFLIAFFIISPGGMMSTYLDMPEWTLYMPSFCIPIMLLMLLFLTLISFLSVRRMLKGTAAEALRPYQPKKMKKSVIEKLPLFGNLSFGTKWNTRDILRHKSRSAMTLLGVFGCMLLLVGGLGMRDTMNSFLDMMDKDINKYETKLILSENAENEDAKNIAKQYSGDWQSSTGISYDGNTISLDIYNSDVSKIGFLTEGNESLTLTDEGVYLCLRLKNTAKIGDKIEFSPYGSDKTYKVQVAGYFRSLVSESIVMTDTYAEMVGVDYKINSIYTDTSAADIESSALLSGKQEQSMIMESYGTFMDIMNIMIVILVLAAVILGIVVLYNLGVMSYVERYRELATLKVLGFRDKHIGKLLITQNAWLTLVGTVLGLPGGVCVLYILIKSLVSEYEMRLCLGPATFIVSIALTFGVSLFVGFMVSCKNKQIDMVEALKGSE